MAKHSYNEECSPLENIAIALFAIASELSALGFGSCSDPNGLGAIEGLSIIMRDGMKDVADSIGSISSSLSEGVTCNITSEE